MHQRELIEPGVAWTDARPPKLDKSGLTGIPDAYLSICLLIWCSSPSLATVKIPWRVNVC